MAAGLHVNYRGIDKLRHWPISGLGRGYFAMMMQSQMIKRLSVMCTVVVLRRHKSPADLVEGIT